MKKNKFKKFFIFLFLIIILFSIVFYLFFTYKNIEIDSNYETTKTQSTDSYQSVESIQQNSSSIADVIEKINHSVVGISKLKNNGNSIFSKNDEASLGIGTGIIVSSNGYILSNAHVTGDKFSTCYVTLENGLNYNGTILWADSDLDLSIIRINAKDLSYVELGDSKNIRVGETVYAIGNPIGFEFRRTVTSGIISAKNRTIKIDESDSSSYMTDLIQTDATINPGNSGGPLILPDGKVIGVNTVKITSAEGIGFAVPINIVKPIINSFILTDSFEEAKLGISAYDKEVVPYLSSNTSFSSGIYVAHISVDGAAYHSDLKIGDIINSIDNIGLNTMNDLRSYIYTKKPGDTVSLNITRGKINKTISAVLGK